MEFGQEVARLRASVGVEKTHGGLINHVEFERPKENICTLQSSRVMMMRSGDIAECSLILS